MDNTFETFLLHPILEDNDRWGNLQMVFFNLRWIFHGVNLFNRETEGLFHFTVDGSLLHAPHAARLVKTDYAKSHACALTGKIKKSIGGSQLLALMEMILTSAVG